MTVCEDVQGLASRQLALDLFQAVVNQGRQLDDALEGNWHTSKLDRRDAAFAHAVAATALRHHGQLAALLGNFLQKPLPRSSGPAHDILLTGLAQLLILRSNAPAAINLSVELAKKDAHARHFAPLVNGVLREAQRREPPLGDPILNMPPWLAAKLDEAYGRGTLQAIAEAHAQEAALDITAKTDAEGWARALEGDLLPTGTIRLAAGERPVTELPGFAEGHWWVQDAAAALPVKLLGGDLAGKAALDLCAAPGGKSAQLASLGAKVTAVDLSRSRMQRMAANMQRLQLDVTLLTEDLRKLCLPQQFDVVVLDAPCSATGTMRRHPDLAHLKSNSQIGKLSAIQRDLLDRAVIWTKPGGLLLYCVCSLLPEEGEQQAREFLARHDSFSLVPAGAGQLGGQSQLLGPEGWLRTLPSMSLGGKTGIDGFFAALFMRH